jgi:hypothetical protein
MRELVLYLGRAELGIHRDHDQASSLDSEERCQTLGRVLHQISAVITLLHPGTPEERRDRAHEVIEISVGEPPLAVDDSDTVTSKGRAAANILVDAVAVTDFLKFLRKHLPPYWPAIGGRNDTRGMGSK